MDPKFEFKLQMENISVFHVFHAFKLGYLGKLILVNIQTN
jgi:hypothetical protein